MVAVELVQVLALEDAKQHRRQRLDGMLHLAHQAALQPDQVARHSSSGSAGAPSGSSL